MVMVSRIFHQVMSQREIEGGGGGGGRQVGGGDGRREGERETGF